MNDSEPETTTVPGDSEAETPTHPGDASLTRLRGMPLLDGLSTRFAEAIPRSKTAFRLATQLAEAAPEPDRRLISEAARLQEVGKLYVPVGLLGRPPSELDRRERKQLAEHYEQGCRLALGAGIPPRACSWILHARERWDGSGPERLEGEEIPLGARILAVCREYLDAPRADGGTDPAAAGDAANQHLRALAGEVLDPALVARAVGEGADGTDR